MYNYVRQSKNFQTKTKNGNERIYYLFDILRWMAFNVTYELT